jgi:CRISPR-associated endonuclease/helicase Cas3
MLSAELEKKPEIYSKALAEEVLGAHRGGQTTLVILNTVRRAQLLYSALMSGGREKQGLLLLHSRFRRPERGRLEERLRNERSSDRIIVATQAVEAGVDMTSSVLFTELAPWSSLVQRFGRCNREGELNDKGGAEIRWVDVELEEGCARPYEIETLTAARDTVAALADAAPRSLPSAMPPRAPKQVIRAGDFEQLFDTDADLSGYDLDISPYIRDTNESAVNLFWRATDGEEQVIASRPASDELCSAPLSKELESWLRSRHDGKLAPVFVEDPNGRNRKRRGRMGWILLDKEHQRLRPGMVLMLDSSMGGYDPELGFVGPQSSAAVDTIEPPPGNPLSDVDVGETTDDDPLTENYPLTVELERHLRHVEALARKIAKKVALGRAADVLARAARWHDVGKAFAPFQERLGRTSNGPLLAKSKKIMSSEMDQQRRYYIPQPTGLRRYFRHELASALTFLDQHDGEPEADLTAFLIAAHHGKVRMGISALPEETPESPQKRIARGVQDGDELPEVQCGPEVSAAGILDLGLMEMGEDESGRPSWAARMQAVLGQLGPFRLAYLESLLRMADWRASIAERGGRLDDE